VYSQEGVNKIMDAVKKNRNPGWVWWLKLVILAMLRRLRWGR
jgi:hypothetical protein